jgi:hypothetical protein
MFARFRKNILHVIDFETIRSQKMQPILGFIITNTPWFTSFSNSLNFPISTMKETLLIIFLNKFMLLNSSLKHIYKYNTNKVHFAFLKS